MENPFHLLVWLDHRTARLFAVTRQDVQELRTIHAPDTGTGHIHHKAGTPGAGHAGPDADFLRQVTAALEHAQEILIAGPGTARFELKAHLERRAPVIDARVVGVEPMDKPAPENLRAFATLFFRQKDLMKRPGP